MPLGVNRRLQIQNVPETVRGLGVRDIPFSRILKDRNANLLKARIDFLEQRSVKVIELFFRGSMSCELALENNEARGKDEVGIDLRVPSALRVHEANPLLLTQGTPMEADRLEGHRDVPREGPLIRFPPRAQSS
jgi:hypothetical protein